MRAVLEVIKKISRRIEEQESKLFHLRNLMSAVVPELDGMPKNPNVSSRVERIAAAITDLEREISEFKQIKLACQLELAELLSERIFSEEINRVLFMRYGLLKKFGEIARELNFSESSIYRFHRAGLLRLGVAPKISDDFEFDSIAIENRQFLTAT